MQIAQILFLISQDPSLHKIQNFVKEKMQKEQLDAAHDLAHFYRVSHWMLAINPKLDPRQAIAAALLHDIVNLPKNSPERNRASEMSAVVARDFLPSCEFNPEEISLIAGAIRDHSYSRGAIPESDLGKALQDADRLEALGSIGLMRVFSTGMRLQAQYFHPEDPWAKHRIRNDAKFSVDHFFEKLLKLPLTMNTKRGRMEAERRCEILLKFLEQLGIELGEALPASLLQELQREAE